MSRLRHSGQVLIIFALALPALLGMLDLGLEVAFSLGERQRVQAAADAAALNGIYCFMYVANTDCVNSATYNPGAGNLQTDPLATRKTRGMALLTATVNGYQNGLNGVTVTACYWTGSACTASSSGLGTTQVR